LISPYTFLFILSPERGPNRGVTLPRAPSCPPGSCFRPVVLEGLTDWGSENTTTVSEARPNIGVLRVAFAGLAATLIGNALGRFAYTPLIPALIAAGWFAPDSVVYFAAANLVGYFIGALLARRISMLVGTVVTMRTTMVLTTIGLAACAWPLGTAWYFWWRLLAGATGGILMVLAAPVVIAETPPALRGRAAGIVFTGVGLGMAMSGTIVPALAREGLTTVWLTLAGAAGLMTIYLWSAVPSQPVQASALAAGMPRLPVSLALLIIAYGFDALGFIPHTVFWVDYIARGLGGGLAVGGSYWIAFGVSAAVGPYLMGLLADRVGFGTAYILAMSAKAVGVALPLLSTTPTMLAISSITVGALISGTTTLCSGWTAEQAGVIHHRQVWGWMTSAFALTQAAGGWGFSLLFTETGSYPLLFVVGASTLMAGAVFALASRRTQTRSA
jgi:MFS family permease